MGGESFELHMAGSLYLNMKSDYLVDQVFNLAGRIHFNYTFICSTYGIAPDSFLTREYCTPSIECWVVQPHVKEYGTCTHAIFTEHFGFCSHFFIHVSNRFEFTRRNM